ncbi:MAG: 4-hydroxy-tetrahydrodipicolinate reductase [Gemmatimonadetes bacterium]|nr:4-hydroxy-tetrahydrodipicolinate reductase [Gemmatimonadota bacterium]
MINQLRIVVSGATGRMGRTLAGLIAAAPDLRLVGGIDRAGARGEAEPGNPAPPLAQPGAAAELLAMADALLDFSAPVFTAELLRREARALAGRALVVGTTGLDEEVLSLLRSAAERSPVVVSANFSVGVNLLLGLVSEAAKRLPPDRYDVEILEAHHRHKADAPSGTALALGRAIAEARSAALDRLRRDGRSGRTGVRPAGEVGFHAIRGGDVVGEHRVLFLGPRERLELAHQAEDRALFAEGALVAARWAARRPPGWYGMRDVLGL